MAPRLELYSFRYRDPRTGKWTMARYRAERQAIAARSAEWEIIGPPEIRNVDPEARYFTPYRREVPSDVGNLGPVIEFRSGKPARHVMIAGVAT